MKKKLLLANKGRALACALAATVLTACVTAPTKDDDTKAAVTKAPAAVKEGHITSTNDVHEYQLANGLKVIIKEDHRAPVVVSQIWYKAGSSYEHNGATGVAHVLEHMMFKGTAKLEANEFSRIISANGGRENAFTGQDYTAYFQQLEKSRLPISFELEADRMANLNLKAEDFAKEIKVVMEERHRRQTPLTHLRTFLRHGLRQQSLSPPHHRLDG